MFQTTFVLLALVFFGCGGSSPASEVPVVPREKPRDRIHLKIEGALGTINEDEVIGGFGKHLAKLQQCVLNRWKVNELVSGSSEFYVRIREDGHVRWALIEKSTLGDWAVQECLRVSASKIVFPRPRGGEAEVRHELIFDLPEGVRAPVEITEDLSKENLEKLVLACGGYAREQRTFIWTGYVGVQGEILSAGVGVNNLDSQAAAQCIVEQSLAWTFEKPGSYPGKTSFTIEL